MFLLQEEVLDIKEMKGGRRDTHEKNKKFTSTSCSVSLKVTITDNLIKTSSLMLVVFSYDGEDTVGTGDSELSTYLEM